MNDGRTISALESAESQHGHASTESLPASINGAAIAARSINNPNQPLTLSERLNGLSSGNSQANLLRPAGADNNQSTT